MRSLVQSLVAALCFTAAPSFAAEPTSVAQQLGAARARYHRAAAGLSTAQAAVSTAHASLRSCQNGRAQLAFSSALTRLEASRKTLEKGRRETEAFRRQLEAARTRIEAGHHLKHESVEEREAKERHYLERLSQDYVAPLGRVADLLGDAEGIDADGALLLRSDRGIERVLSGDDSVRRG